MASGGGTPITRMGRFSGAVSSFFAERGIYLGKRSTRVHVAVYRWSRGRLGRRVPGWPSAEIALVNDTGARSGEHRTSPLMFCRDGDSIAVVASKAGLPENPAWVPQPAGQPGDDGRDRRRTAAGPRPGRDPDAERERLWPRFVASFPEDDLAPPRCWLLRIWFVILDPR